jgi:hypothetical protein
MVLFDDTEGNVFYGRQFSTYKEAANFSFAYMERRRKRGLKTGYCIIESKIVSDA